jgi:beta-fructofuranosidase
VCLARARNGDLVTWRKDERNPVIEAPPPELGLRAFRDPFLWRDGARWVMAMGAGDDAGGAVLRFCSADLVDWSYDGPILTAADLVEPPVSMGDAWECPQLFPVGDRHVLLFSVCREQAPQTLHPVAVVGDYRDGRFEPHRVERFDHGADCYAPAVMADDRGRRLAWGWSWEGRDEAAAREQGWAGVLTLPRVLGLAPGGRLGIAPAPELEALRGAHGGPEIRGRELEIAVTADAGTAETVRLTVCASPGGEERTAIEWDRATGRLSIDRSQSSLDPRARGGRHGGVLDLAPGEPLELRVFVDRSILEVYANGRMTLTERIYPTREDSTGVSFGGAGGEPVLQSFDAWVLKTDSAT